MLASKRGIQDPPIVTKNPDPTDKGLVSRRSHSASGFHKQQCRASNSTKNSAGSATSSSRPFLSQVSGPGFNCDVNVHSGSTSASSAQNSIDGGPVPPQCNGIPVKGSKLKAFDKPISEQLKHRFDDLKRLYSGPLLDTIRKKPLLEAIQMKKKRSPNVYPADIAMKCKFMGTSESTAELHIVVQCEEAISRRVRDFFAQEHVAKDLGTDFRLHVIEEALRRLAAIHDVRAVGKMGLRNTLCGLQVQLSHSGKSRIATIGGLVMVTTTRKALFSIIAGHPLSEIREQIEDHLTPLEETGSDERTFVDYKSERLPTSGDEESLHEDLADEAGLKIDLGIVSYDSFLSGTADDNCDWALVELNHENWRPNRLDFSPKSEEAGDARDRSKRWGDDVDLFCTEYQSPFSRQPAVVITCRGIQQGTLTQNKSSILMHPGKAFVETLEFTLDSKSGEHNRGKLSHSLTLFQLSNLAIRDLG